MTAERIGDSVRGGVWRKPDATEVAFPLGGVGTGTISIGARGNLRDFEIWNEPRKGLTLPYTHFTLWTRSGDGPGVTRVLEGRIPPPYAASHGIHPNLGGGLPRFASSRFRGRYPTAELELRDPDVPVEASLLAFTPFVPLDPDESGLPCAIFEWTLTNRSTGTVNATIVGSMLNPAVFSGTDDFGNLRSYPHGEVRNTWRGDDRVQGVLYEAPDVLNTDLAYGNAALATIDAPVTTKPEWYRGGWYDTLREFWDDLSSDGRLTELDSTQVAARGMVGPEVVNVVPGSVGVPMELAAGESRTITFILSWYFPNRVNGWDRAAPTQPPTTRVRYSGRFADAWAVTRYVCEHLDWLRARTVAFRDALFESSIVDPFVKTLGRGTLRWRPLLSPASWRGCVAR